MRAEELDWLMLNNPPESTVRDLEANRKLCRETFAVRNDDQDIALPLVEIEQHRCDGCGRGLIEIARWLIAQHQPRLQHERARDRGALLLTTGQLARPMFEPLTQPDLLEARSGARGVIAAILSCHQRRNEYVFKDSALRQEAMILEYEPDTSVAEIGQRGGGEIERILPVESDGAV